jgi:hypothetical protein
MTRQEIQDQIETAQAVLDIETAFEAEENAFHADMVTIVDVDFGAYIVDAGAPL